MNPHLGHKLDKKSLIQYVDSEVTVVYLDFVRDMEQMTDLLNKNNVSAIKYTGQMALENRVSAENMFLKGDIYFCFCSNRIV